ncbi:hypothetical protein G4B88_009197 [Cannabis sativa]|uniref:Cytochrome P450 n=1 Tax=Cannabis sativa TaxID=3483 RepID=A0A7J6G2H7_CANSA|nr:hypothetical protein G4B88_009197 [Cannabis sativa]
MVVYCRTISFGVFKPNSYTTHTNPATRPPTTRTQPPPPTTGSGSDETYQPVTHSDETHRLGNVTPGLLRKAIKDIPVKGFTIPSGWTILLATSAQQLSPNTLQNPLEFNPWRWKELDSEVISKNFMPFDGGMRQCAAGGWWG